MPKERLWIGVWALAISGCAVAAPNPRLTLRYEKGVDTTDLSSLIQRAGAGPVAVVDLGRTAWVSHHLAIVREAEAPHYHRFHDLTVFVLRGEGAMDLDGRRFPMKAGDVVYVQRGVRHFFRNTGREAAAAFAVFSPPFDGRDTVTAEAPPAAQPAEPPQTSGSKSDAAAKP